jgi:hypothetical protein
MPAAARLQAIKLNGNVPIATMLNGLTEAKMAALSRPMSSSPSKEASPFLEGLVLVSVLFVIMIFPFDLCSVGIIFRTKRLRNERGHSAR